MGPAVGDRFWGLGCVGPEVLGGRHPLEVNKSSWLDGKRALWHHKGYSSHPPGVRVQGRGPVRIKAPGRTPSGYVGSEETKARLGEAKLQ